MVSIQQVQAGAAKYIDQDILPHLTGAKRLGLGIYSALASQHLAETAMKYRTHPAVEVLHLFDGDGNVDIDALYQAAAPLFEGGERHTIHIPVIGDMTVDRTDLETFYRYIKEG